MAIILVLAAAKYQRPFNHNYCSEYFPNMLIEICIFICRDTECFIAQYKILPEPFWFQDPLKYWVMWIVYDIYVSMIISMIISTPTSTTTIKGISAHSILFEIIGGCFRWEPLPKYESKCVCLSGYGMFYYSTVSIGFLSNRLWFQDPSKYSRLR